MVKMCFQFLVHQNQDTLLDHVDVEVLPLEYGGTAGKFDDLEEEWREGIVKRRKWFEQQETVKASGDGLKQISHSCGFEDIIGIEGSFRKLEID